jgi:acyl carrier protein
MDTLEERIRSILAIELQIDQARITPEVSLRRDLGMDSIAALNILYAMEEEFGLETLDPSEIGAVRTVADVETLVRSHAAPAGQR